MKSAGLRGFAEPVRCWAVGLNDCHRLALPPTALIPGTCAQIREKSLSSEGVLTPSSSGRFSGSSWSQGLPGGDTQGWISRSSGRDGTCIPQCQLEVSCSPSWQAQPGQGQRRASISLGCGTGRKEEHSQAVAALREGGRGRCFAEEGRSGAVSRGESSGQRKSSPSPRFIPAHPCPASRGAAPAQPAKCSLANAKYGNQ